MNILGFKVPGGLILAAGAAGVLALVVGFVLVTPQRNHVDAVTSRVGEVTSKADARASEIATEAVAGQTERSAQNQADRKVSNDEILRQPGASLPTDPGVFSATLRGLCRQPHYPDPRCVQLREKDSAAASR